MLFPATKDPRPNIILILTDDLGIGSVSCYNPDLSQPTPNIDRLAANGIQFDNFYVTSPVCSPSRASIMTGLAPQKVAIERVLKPGKAQGRKSEFSSHINIATALREAGYSTTLIGKWHLGYSENDHPLKTGFEKFSGFLNGHIDYINHKDPNGKLQLTKNGNNWQSSGKHLTSLLTDEAINEIKSHPSKPFFLMLSYASPHIPIILPGEKPVFASKNKRITDTPERYQKLVAELDNQIGKLLNAVEESNENTIIIFLSDQGCPQYLGGNYPYQGGKATLLEGGIKVPAIVYWPGQVKSQRVRKFHTSLDIFPSLMTVAGITLDAPELSKNSLFTDFEIPDSSNFRWQFQGMKAIRSGIWKAVFYPDKNSNEKTLNRYTGFSSDSTGWTSWKNPDGNLLYVLLFNLDSDPTEQVNLAATHPDKVTELWYKLNTRSKTRNK